RWSPGLITATELRNPPSGAQSPGKTPGAPRKVARRAEMLPRSHRDLTEFFRDPEISPGPPSGVRTPHRPVTVATAARPRIRGRPRPAARHRRSRPAGPARRRGGLGSRRSQPDARVPEEAPGDRRGGRLVVARGHHGHGHVALPAHEPRQAGALLPLDVVGEPGHAV